jgi:hypothetical protein
MTTIVNRTPHVVRILVDPLMGRSVDLVRTIEPTFPTPRTATAREAVSVIDGIPIDRVIYGGVVDLPPPEPGVFLIVSLMVAQAVPQRKDLLVPGEVVRDAAGGISACKGLSRPG